MKPLAIHSWDWVKYNALFLSEHFLGQSLYKKLFQGTEKSLISRVESKLESQLKNPKFYHHHYESFLETYENVENVEIKKIRTNSKVQLFKGAAAKWNCSSWDLDYFKKNYGEKEVTVLNSDGLFEKGVQQFGSTSMAQYIDMLKKGSKVYLKFSPMVHHDSSLRKGFDIDWLEQFSMPGSFGRKFFLFIGGGNTLTPIHTALSNTVFVQVYGKKKWTFWVPNDRFFLNVRANRRAYFYTDFDPFSDQNPDFPLAKYANKVEVTLEAGDVLWFPGFFWHHVVNEIDSIGVAYKTAHFPSALKGSISMTLLSFLATKPFLLESLIKSNFKNNERVFLE